MQSNYSPTLEDVLPEFHGAELILKPDAADAPQQKRSCELTAIHEIDLKTQEKKLDTETNHASSSAVTGPYLHNSISSASSGKIIYS